MRAQRVLVSRGLNLPETQANLVANLPDTQFPGLDQHNSFHNLQVPESP